MGRPHVWPVLLKSGKVLGQFVVTFIEGLGGEHRSEGIREVSMALRLIVEDVGNDVLLIRARGEIDHDTTPRWEDLVRCVIRRRSSAVIVDVGHLDYISAGGLEVLLALAANQLLMSGRLIVAGAHAGTRRLAQLVGLWDLAAEAPSVRVALHTAEGRGPKA
jgi:stage II sporulation protein AA (anti-sigma F factor antagonist)